MGEAPRISIVLSYSNFQNFRSRTMQNCSKNMKSLLFKRLGVNLGVFF